MFPAVWWKQLNNPWWALNQWWDYSNLHPDIVWIEMGTVQPFYDPKLCGRSIPSYSNPYQQPVPIHKCESTNIQICTNPTFWSAVWPNKNNKNKNHNNNNNNNNSILFILGWHERLLKIFPSYWKYPVLTTYLVTKNRTTLIVFFGINQGEFICHRIHVTRICTYLPTFFWFLWYIVGRYTDYTVYGSYCFIHHISKWQKLTCDPMSFSWPFKSSKSSRSLTTLKATHVSLRCRGPSLCHRNCCNYFGCLVRIFPQMFFIQKSKLFQMFGIGFPRMIMNMFFWTTLKNPLPRVKITGLPLGLCLSNHARGVANACGTPAMPRGS